MESQINQPIPALGNWARWVTTALIIVGVACSMAVWVLMHRAHEHALKVEFHALAEERARLAARALEAGFNDLWAVRSLYEASDNVTAEEFDAFTHTMFDRQVGLRAIGFARREPSGTSHMFYPVRQVASRDGVGIDRGRNLAAVPALESALKRSLEVDGPCFAEPFQQSGVANDAATVFVLLPVFDPPDQPPGSELRRAEGVLFAVLDTKTLVENAVSSLSAGGIDCSLYVVDEARAARHVYTSVSGKRITAAQEDNAGPEVHHLDDWRTTFPMNIGGRQWKVRCSSDPAFFSQRRSATSLVALLTGLMITALVSLLVHQLLRRTTEVERLVKKRTAEAHEARDKARALFESSRDAILVLQGDRIVDCNNAALRMFRCQRKVELCGRRPVDLSPLEQASGYQSSHLATEFLKEAVRDGTTYFEWVHRRVDGQEFPCEVMLSLVQGGDTPVIQASIRDVSSRKREQSRLAESEERFRQLAENIDDVYWISDAASHEVIYVSPAFETLWGIPCADLYRKPSAWLERVHAKDRRRVEKAFHEAAAKGEYDVEYCVVRPDGSECWVRAIGFPVCNSEGVVYRIAGVARDITERRQFEKDLRRAIEQAEEASRAKSQFLASMSHELRTPLNGVIGMTELLLGTELNDRQRQFTEACHTSGESLLELINDILDFSKIEAGRLELDCHEFDLEELIASTADITRFKAQQKGLEFICHLDQSALLVVHGDSVRLRQVLVNLIGNATKFTEQGEVVVRIDANKGEGDKSLVRFSVSDTGIGITPDGLQRLFQSFSQVDSSTTRKYGGTGLGLAISKRLVELMGGSIDIESVEGEGSTFTFTVPLKVVAGRKAKHGLDHADVRQQRVLIVDDNATNRVILQEHVQSWGMQTQSVANADDAVTAINCADQLGNPFHLVLTDLQMPGKSGLDLAAALAVRSDLNVILLGSCEAMPSTAEQQRLRIARALQKPVKQSDLYNAIVEVVTGASQEERDDTHPPVHWQIAPESATSGPRILLAEDNRVNRLYVTELLKRHGHECDIVENGREATEAARRNQYCLVLMDCQMPEVDGFEATRRIRDLESSGQMPGHLPIIALTANAIKGDRERCLEAGMDDYLSKPIDSAKLLDAIQRWTNSANEREDINHPCVAESNAAAVPINHETLIARCLNDVEFANSLLDEFAASGTQRVLEIRQAVDRSDAQAAAEAAHALKGAAGILCADSLQTLAAELEAAGRSGEVSALGDMVVELATEMNRCLQHLPATREMLHASKMPS